MNNLSISLGKRQLVDSIWKSAGIEGLGTTFPNTEKILSNLPVQTRRDEVLFIVNMKRAWYFLFDNIDYPNNLAFLRELNKICMEEISNAASNLSDIPLINSKCSIIIPSCGSSGAHDVPPIVTSTVRNPPAS